jgi:hypothetical protein
MGIAIQGAKSKPNAIKKPRVSQIAPKRTMSLDDKEALQLYPSREYREKLWDDFAAFAREHSAWVVSPRNGGRGSGQVNVQLAQDSDLETALENFPRFNRVARLGDAVRLSHGRFQSVRQISVTLWLTALEKK